MLRLAALLFATTLSGHALGIECAPSDKALVKQVKGLGVRVMDFSASSVACLEDFAGKVSKRDMLLVAESGSIAWRGATVEAAKRLQNEGILVAVVYAKDTDDSNKTADTIIWANGVKRDIVPVKIGGQYIIDDIVAAPDVVINMMYDAGSSIWNEYLKVRD